MKKLLYTPIVFILTLTNLMPVVASMVPRILIVQLQTGSKASASEEYVSLYNDSDLFIDASTLKLEYSSSTSGTSWTTKATLTGIWKPRSYYLLSSSNYLSVMSNSFFSAGLAKTGGHVRVAQTSQTNEMTILDQVGWGSAVQAEGKTPTTAPLEGETVERIEKEYRYQDTDNNATDFAVNSHPTPINDTYIGPTPPALAVVDPYLTPYQVDTTPSPVLSQEAVPDSPNPSTVPIIETLPSQTVSTIIPTAPTPIPTPADEAEPLTIPTPQHNPSPEVIATLLPQPLVTNYSSLSITELYPNPASPQSDDEDEFIELYNNSEASIDLRNIHLQSGNSYSYHYSLSGIISPKSYLVLYVKDTKLTLSNTIGKARILDQDGITLSETDIYENALPGQSWSFIEGDWQWTTVVTPAEVNKLPIVDNTIIQAAADIVPKANTSSSLKNVLKKLVAPKVAGAATSTSKAKSPKVASASKSKVKASATPKSSPKPSQQPKVKVSGVAQSTPPSKNALLIHPQILAGVGVLAVGYAVYEYRIDIRNKYWQLRRNRKLRSIIRTET